MATYEVSVRREFGSQARKDFDDPLDALRDLVAEFTDLAHLFERDGTDAKAYVLQVRVSP